MRLRRSLPTALAVLATLAAFVTVPTPAAFADSTTDTYIVQLKDGVSADAVVPKLMGDTAEVVDKVFQGGIADLNATQANALAKSPYVKSVHKDAVISAAATQVGAPWDLDMLDSRTAALDGSYTYPNDGSGVTVYVLDSGIQRSHVEFLRGEHLRRVQLRREQQRHHGLQRSRHRRVESHRRRHTRRSQGRDTGPIEGS